MCKLLNSLSESSPTHSPLQTTGKRMGNEEITWSLLGSTETCWIGQCSSWTTIDHLVFPSSLFSFFLVELRDVVIQRLSSSPSNDRTRLQASTFNVAAPTDDHSYSNLNSPRYGPSAWPSNHSTSSLIHASSVSLSWNRPNVGV